MAFKKHKTTQKSAIKHAPSARQPATRAHARRLTARHASLRAPRRRSHPLAMAFTCPPNTSSPAGTHAAPYLGPRSAAKSWRSEKRGGGPGRTVNPVDAQWRPRSAFKVSLSFFFRVERQGRMQQHGGGRGTPKRLPSAPGQSAGGRALRETRHAAARGAASPDSPSLGRMTPLGAYSVMDIIIYTGSKEGACLAVDVARRHAFVQN